MKRDHFRLRKDGVRVNRTKKWHDIHTRSTRKRARTEVLPGKKYLPFPNGQKTTIIFFPQIFSLTKNFGDSISAINKLRDAAFSGKKVLVNLSFCKEISLEAGLVLSAEVERCMKSFPGSVWGTYPQDTTARFILDEMGFFAHIQVRPAPSDCYLDPNMEVVRITSGEANKAKAKDVSDATKGMADLFDLHDGVKGGSRISGAVQEAMINVISYAYPEELRSDMRCLPKWWRVGLRDKEEHVSMIAFYDLGVGIPETLKSEFKWKDFLASCVKALEREPEDHELLRRAIEERLTSTQKPQHGHGLGFMKGVIDRVGKGLMVILTQNALYTYSMPSGKVESMALSDTVNGTLIMWQINYSEGEK